MTEEQVRAEHYRQAEASFRLEGFDPTGHEEYQELKARVIAGEIDVDDAIRQTVERYKALSQPSVPELATAK